MVQVISAVNVINGNMRTAFVVGKLVGEQVIGDIIEVDGTYKVFNDQDELMYEIKNCPVIVSYKKVEA